MHCIALTTTMNCVSEAVSVLVRQEVWGNAHLTEISRVGSAMMGKSTVICVPFRRDVGEQSRLRQASASKCAQATSLMRCFTFKQ